MENYSSEELENFFDESPLFEEDRKREKKRIRIIE